MHFYPELSQLQLSGREPRPGHLYGLVSSDLGAMEVRPVKLAALFLFLGLCDVLQLPARFQRRQLADIIHT